MQGKPSDTELGFVTQQNARAYISKMPPTAVRASFYERYRLKTNNHSQSIIADLSLPQRRPVCMLVVVPALTK